MLQKRKALNGKSLRQMVSQKTGVKPVPNRFRTVPNPSPFSSPPPKSSAKPTLPLTRSEWRSACFRVSVTFRDILYIELPIFTPHRPFSQLDPRIELENSTPKFSSKQQKHDVEPVI